MKNFIRGIGVGVIAATLILACTYGITNDKLSDQEIIQRAEQLGMTKQSDSIFKTEKPENQEKKSDNTVQQSTPEPDKTMTQTEVTGQNVNVEAPTAVPVQELISFQVESGDNGIRVSQKLKEKDLVDNANGFNEYLRKKRLQTKLQVGTYELKKGMTYEEIANEIIK